jgi:hypothetical protein
MRKRRVMCYCKSYCLVCQIDLITRESVYQHNLRVACHGERQYNTAKAERVLLATAFKEHRND